MAKTWVANWEVEMAVHTSASMPILSGLDPSRAMKWKNWDPGTRVLVFGTIVGPNPARIQPPSAAMEAQTNFLVPATVHMDPSFLETQIARSD